MSRFTRLGRLAAAAALVASGATVALTSTAGATNTNVTVDCSQVGTPLSLDNSDTVTVTVSGSSCGNVIFDNTPSAFHGTVTVDRFPLSLGATLPVSDGTVIVFTAPASGSAQNSISFWPNLQSPPPISSVYFSYPAATGSVVDNGDGTVNVSYAGEVVLFLMASGSTCPPDLSNPITYVYAADSNPQSPYLLPASPFVLSSSTNMHPFAGQGIEPVAAGDYQACLFDGLGSDTIASAAVSIGQAAPTTTTTAGTDPVTPAFTG